MFVILDLEWNAGYSKKERKFINEIIEFGAVKVDDDLNIVDTFSMLIRPQIGKRLNRVTAELTKLTFDELKESTNTFSHVLSRFIKFLDNNILLTWGTTDITTLLENYKYFYHTSRMNFIESYCNLQEYCMKCMNLTDPGKQLGVINCAQLLGIEQDEDSLHRAQSDAELELKIFQKLFNKDLFMNITEKANCEEFYKKLFYKTVYISSLESPLINKKIMRFDCTSCGKKLKQLTDWHYKNRGFVADFMCKSCQKNYKGKFIYKKLYNSLNIQSKLTEIEENEKE